MKETLNFVNYPKKQKTFGRKCQKILHIFVSEQFVDRKFTKIQKSFVLFWGN